MNFLGTGSLIAYFAAFGVWQNSDNITLAISTYCCVQFLVLMFFYTVEHKFFQKNTNVTKEL